MARPRSETPKEHISIIRAKKKDGWTYVQRVVSVYDPKIKNSRRVSTESLGKLPPGETDLKNMVPLTPRRKKGSLKATKIAAPAKELPDPRDASRIIYPLDVVFCVIILAAMGGKTSCTEIAEYWRHCRPLLKKTFPNYPDEDISHDTVRRITMIIGKAKNSVLIRQYVKMLSSKLSHPVVAVDGQAVKASRNKSDRSPYILNVMDADNEIILAQQVIGEKNNEITYASKLISTLDISGAIVTADALNTQREFAAQIIEAKADYCLALKANQDMTYEQVRGFFELNSHSYKSAVASVSNKGGKITKRKTRVLPARLLPREIVEKWIGLEEGCIVEAITDTVVKKSGEILEPQVRYYLSSLRFEAQNVEEVLQRAIRMHWAIENKGHWALDMAFNQDRLQCTNAQYLAGRTVLNKIALNFTSKIQTKMEEESGKDAPSKPILRARLNKVEDMLAAMNECILR